MKLIIAYIQSDKVEEVKQALYERKVTKMSVMPAQGCGQQMGYSETYRGVVSEIKLLRKVRFEIAVNDDYVKPAVEAIVKGARTGKIGDGKIFILELADCIRIRTGDTGKEAIG